MDNVPLLLRNSIIALYFSRKIFRSAEGSPFLTDLDSAFNKIQAALPAKHLAKLERIEDMFIPLAKMYKTMDVNHEVYESIRLALLYQNPLPLEYKSRKSNQLYPFKVHPYSLLLYQGEFYLLCFVPEKGIRYFTLKRIKRAERLKERFDIPEGFLPSEFVNSSFGLFKGEPISLKVLFNEELSDYIQRRKWHPSQIIKKLKNGRILLSITASGKEELKAWILIRQRHF